MKRNLFTLWGAAALLVATAACQKSSPAEPTAAADPGPAVARDARSGVTVIAPTPVSPASNASVSWGAQPYTLTVTNGVSTSKAALTYFFQVATDAGFAHNACPTACTNGVTQGSGATTSLAIDHLAGSQTYYWRVRDDSSGVTGPYSVVRSFTVGPEVVLGTPTVSSPANNSQAFAPLTFVINNVSRSGPVGPIVYRLQISTSSAFSSTVYDNTTAEGPGGAGATTSILVTSSLQSGATYFWRVSATDTTNNITTSFSSANAFVAQSFNMATAVIRDNPPDLGSWPQTANLTLVDFDPGAIIVDFDKREGPNRWPDVPFGEGNLEYTLGMCQNIGGQWYCSAVVQFWFERELTAGGLPSEVGLNWFYNGARWAPLGQPNDGDTVGMFVAAGNLRGQNFSQNTCPEVCERSNVALVPFTTGAIYNFAANAGHPAALRGKR